MDTTVKEFNLFYIEDSYDSLTTYQELVDSDTNESVYSVSNMSDCPEDAIIDRCLFSAYNYIDALNEGIALAKNGYDKAVITGIFEKEW